MGEVYKPEDFEKKRLPHIPDMKPTPPMRSMPPINYGVLLEEIRFMKIEIEKIKKALKIHGIPID
jgi:hypothetical protein